MADDIDYEQFKPYAPEIAAVRSQLQAARWGVRSARTAAGLFAFGGVAVATVSLVAGVHAFPISLGAVGLLLGAFMAFSVVPKYKKAVQMGEDTLAVWVELQRKTMERGGRL